MLQRISFSSKQIKVIATDILFDGNQSGVKAAAWRGKIIAWADASHVRLMDMSTQTALCYFNAPSYPANAGLSANICPCSLHWESPSSLLVGWADSFRHVEILNENNDEYTEQSTSCSARLAASWRADGVIMSVVAFDVDHIAMLSLLPAEDDNDDSMVPELQIVSRRTGEVLSSDSLPMLATAASVTATDFRLLTTHQCSSRRMDYRRWDILSSMTRRGDFRGHAPLMFVVSSSDFVIARVCDTADRVVAALAKCDLRGAIECAQADRHSLRHYKLEDLIALYLEDLLESGKFSTAASECARLIGPDGPSWIAWIHRFSSKKCLTWLAPFIPISMPKLPSDIYSVRLCIFSAERTTFDC